ncbi:beta-ketoacyl-ACP synthase III [Geoalkalibacter halelectricus]|uniref:beta-ketoacyl-ACP synthase III n=1 Tax=Geoalkalibacter halelectricus TaxID=2847045 RepID=UPI003D1EADFD
MQAHPHVKILGTGHAVPEKILTNADLEQMVDTSDQWIIERTGIRTRHIAAPGTGVALLAAAAARNALRDADLEPQDIDLIIVGTVSGDYKFPATACLVQQQLGLERAAAFDVSAACSGFLYSLRLAESLIRTGDFRHALVIGAEVLSSQVDWSDRNTCTLFGDGAGAAVVGPSSDGRGILAMHLASDGRHSQLLINPGCGSANPPSPDNLHLHTIRMEGREVFRHAVAAMCDGLDKVLAKSGARLEDIDLLIPHQANLRIIQAVGKKAGIGEEKVYVNVDRFGNTSAASIPIAIDEARRMGHITSGQLVAAVTFGAGFTWAAGLIRF